MHLATTIAASLLLAADSNDVAAKRELEMWQGTWQAVSMETDGKAAPPEALAKIKLTVIGTNYHFQNGDFSEHGTYQFDAAKNPRALDIVVGDGKDKGKVYSVIYKVGADELVICLDSANKKRPTEFTGKAGSGNVVEVWRRTSNAKAVDKSEFARTSLDLGIVVGDLTRSVKFYTEAIGFKESSGLSIPGAFAADTGLTVNVPLEIRVLVLGDDPAATKLKLMHIAAQNTKPGDNAFIHSQLGYRYLTIFVNDINAAAARLVKANVKPIGKTPMSLPPGFLAELALIVIRDPDGNMIELIGPKK